MSFSFLTKSVIIAVTINLLAGLSVFAEGTYELTCRNKAKEIAAETYKNCVTENRQSQIEQIRSDYKEKLATLKSHYDGELKKIGGKSTASSDQVPRAMGSQKSNSKAMRASGARGLPKKAIRTQVIDLSTPSTESTTSPDESTTQSQNRLNTDSDSAQDVEIVELPTQE